MLGVNEEGVAPGEAASNHSPLFHVNEDALIVGVRTLVGFALDYAAVTGAN
jgi:metal-dependent amidase/aminoacylase/carboxypeptidase family protein